MKPVGWQSGRKYPMVLSIHGGPAGSTATTGSMNSRFTPRSGWAVFFTNPRGSTGYGEKFDRGIEQRMGWQGLHRHHERRGRGVSREPMDRQDRLGVTGGSYGGYMTNWIVGHTTLQGRGHAAQHLELHQRRRHARRSLRARGRFGGDIFET